MDIFEQSLLLHKDLKGKLDVANKLDIQTREQLSQVYSPGVAAPCEEIYKDPGKVYDYTIKANTIAIVSDGSAVLGLGNIGPLAAIPVMEGKAMLFKKFAGINGFPICLNTQDTEEIIQIVKNIASVFGGINLEDISSPRCFEIEARLQNIGIPVFHDDQHGTAIVVLAALLNFCRATGRKMGDLKVVINGAGAAGIAIARYIARKDPMAINQQLVKSVIVCDSISIIHSQRENLNAMKRELLTYINPDDIAGSVFDALKGADVFIGVSKANLLKEEHIRSMSPDPLILALANPIPEILPFLGALQAKASRINLSMKFAAAEAIAAHVKEPTKDKIIPDSLDPTVATSVAEAVRSIALTHNF